jgi:hypothetical protein
MDLIAIFIFYKKSQGIQARLSFSEEFKHCNVITFDGTDWVMIDFDSTGLLTRRINCKTGSQLIRSIRVIQDVTAIISVEVKKRVKIKWKPFLVRSCNEISRHATGIDINFTFNPIHLYKKLLKYRNLRNYEMLSHWRRKHHGVFRRQ